MLLHFIRLQWKSFFRSSSFGKGLALKILMAFFGIYMMVSLASLGAGLFFILEKIFPGVDPVRKICEYLLYWMLIELFVRFFMQKLPVMDVKPFLALPIKKSTITHYILGRSVFSFYNVMAPFLFIPFAIVLFVKGYSPLNIIFWLLALFFLVLALNFINFIINKSNTGFVFIVGILIILYGLDYFSIFPIRQKAGQLFYVLYQNPVWSMVPLGITLLLYGINYRFLRSRVFLDASLKKHGREAKTSDLAWTKRFGDMGPFLQLDLKLIWRNKRTRTQAVISLLFVFYGLIFYTMGDFGLDSPMMVFVGIFITGIFLTNFGQFIPAWDSAYYPMMMAQNIPLRKYLESKAGLISVSIVAMFLLSIPYAYFGWQALAINFASALYNLGVNIPVILFFGSFNKKRIELDKSPFGNMQGTSATQFLIILPVLGLPILIFTVLDYLISWEVAVVVLSMMGMIGFMFKNSLLNAVTEQYRRKKYVMIAGFKERDS